MRIQAVGGDIAEIAPGTAEAMVLWLRSGYCIRHSTWHHKIVPRYHGRCATIGVGGDPWRSPEDRLFRLDPPDGQLRLVYVFANPDDRQGVGALDEVPILIERCLDQLAQHGCRSVAMIHIPIASPDGAWIVNQDGPSAAAMIEAARLWDARNPEEIDDVFMVDLTNGFREQLDGG